MGLPQNRYFLHAAAKDKSTGLRNLKVTHAPNTIMIRIFPKEEDAAEEDAETMIWRFRGFSKTGALRGFNTGYAAITCA